MKRSTKATLAMLLVLVLAAALAAPAAAQGYRLRVVADSAQGFGGGFFCPAINDVREIAVAATRDDGTDVVVRWSDGSLRPIAEATGRFEGFPTNVSINDRGNVSFAARLRQGEGVFLRRGGEIVTIARTEPGRFNFISVFNTSVNDAGQVAFAAELDEEFGFDEGLFVGDGGRVRTIFLASTSQFAGDTGRPSINDAGQIAFEESLDDFTRGIFLFSAGGFVTIADENTSGIGSVSAPQVNNRGVVVFKAALEDPTEFVEAIMTGSGGPLTTVADTRGPFSDFGFFGGPSINDAGEVAFTATLDGAFGTGVYTGPDPVADKVVAPGDPLAGSVVTSASSCNESLANDGRVTFRAELEDGRSVILLAAPERV